MRETEDPIAGDARPEYTGIFTCSSGGGGFLVKLGERPDLGL